MPVAQCWIGNWQVSRSVSKRRESGIGTPAWQQPLNWMRTLVSFGIEDTLYIRLYAACIYCTTHTSCSWLDEDIGWNQSWRAYCIVRSFSDYIHFLSQGLTLTKQAVLHAYVARQMQCHLVSIESWRPSCMLFTSTTHTTSLSIRNANPNKKRHAWYVPQQNAASYANCSQNGEQACVPTW